MSSCYDHTDGTIHTSFACLSYLFHLDSFSLLHGTLYASDALAYLALIYVMGAQISHNTAFTIFFTI